MKALFVNGSPRPNKNTYKLLLSAMEGAQDSGAECEMVHLYDYEYTGCQSCFSCKVKGNDTEGLCATDDELTPILEKACDADILVIGSPVYFAHPSGQVRCFIERLVYPRMTYRVENGEHVILNPKPVKAAMIFTMNCPEKYMEEYNYKIILGATVDTLKMAFGNCEVLYFCDTCQFSDYNRYNAEIFDVEKKIERRKTQFPIDLRKTYDLGKKLAE
jgi:multimeric flavodoxin WrbA